jgi:Kef-type K+ transport system membrane component KefB
MEGSSVKKYKLVWFLHFGNVLVQTLVWIVLTVVTFGVALPFFGYYFVRLIINRTEIHKVAG